LPKYLVLAVLALIAGLAGGCSGDALTLTANQTTQPTEASLAATGEATPDTPAFNPFSDGPSTTIGRREVMQNPSMAEVMKVGTLPEMSLGRADAPVTIIKYASMTCPYCRRFQLETFPVLKKEYIDTGKVRFIIREFPIGKQSGLATVALRCAPADKYFALYDTLMAQQATWVSQEVRPDPIFKVAAQVGMSRAQFDSCRENRGMIAGLNWVKDRGRTLGVIGTPNFFVQGKLMKSVIGIKEIHEMVDPILAGRVAATDTGTGSR
jgi:protein-disulfide isomerase